MKSIAVLTIAVFFLTGFSAKDENLVGVWKGEDNGDVGYIVFDDEGYVAFHNDGDVMGGKSFEIEGVKASMTYSVNFEADPCEIDMEIKAEENGTELEQMKGILKFNGNNEIELCLGFDSETGRPTQFGTDECITLHRVKAVGD